MFTSVQDQADTQFLSWSAGARPQLKETHVQVDLQEVPFVDRRAGKPAVDGRICGAFHAKLTALREHHSRRNTAVATIYPETRLAVIGFGSAPRALHATRAPVQPEKNYCESYMAEALTHGLAELVHAAITSLLVPTSVMEVRAALIRACSPDWFRHDQAAWAASFRRETEVADAAAFLLAAVVHGDYLWVVNVGRNQALLWRNQKLKALSVVHEPDWDSEDRQLARLDARTREFLLSRGASRAITIGENLEQSEPQISCVPLEDVAGATLLMLSPDVLKNIGPQTLQATLAAVEGGQPQDMAEAVVRVARRAGLEGNIDVVAVKIADGTTPPSGRVNA